MTIQRLIFTRRRPLRALLARLVEFWRNHFAG